MTHTPGPWTISPSFQAFSICSARHLSSLAVVKVPLAATLKVDECHANARLMCAAPDLLESLRPLVAAMPLNGGMIRFDGDELAAARAAILKATGGAA